MLLLCISLDYIFRTLMEHMPDHFFCINQTNEGKREASATVQSSITSIEAPPSLVIRRRVFINI